MAKRRNKENSPSAPSPDFDLVARAEADKAEEGWRILCAFAHERGFAFDKCKSKGDRVVMPLEASLYDPKAPIPFALKKTKTTKSKKGIVPRCVMTLSQLEVILQLVKDYPSLGSRIRLSIKGKKYPINQLAFSNKPNRNAHLVGLIGQKVSPGNKDEWVSLLTPIIIRAKLEIFAGEDGRSTALPGRKVEGHEKQIRFTLERPYGDKAKEYPNSGRHYFMGMLKVNRANYKAFLEGKSDLEPRLIVASHTGSENYLGWKRGMLGVRKAKLA